jgi:hypothetical protein
VGYGEFDLPSPAQPLETSEPDAAEPAVPKPEHAEELLQYERSDVVLMVLLCLLLILTILSLLFPSK